MATIGLVNGSVQPKNYTGYTLRAIKEELDKLNYNVVEIPLKKFQLPFPGEQIDNDNSDEMRKLMESADAFIIGSPEYNGSFTAKLKLMIENSGFPSKLKGKPLKLVGVASGILGATKSLEQLRTVFSHVGAIVLPRVVSISQIENRFDDSGNCIDEEVEKDIKSAVENLIDFLNILKC